MTTLTAAKSITGAFTPEVFAAHLATQSTAPAWWLDRKRAAYEKFAVLPMPQRTDESWRFSNIMGLTLDGFEVGSITDGVAADNEPFGPTALTFVNNAVLGQGQPRVQVPAGVIVTTLSEAATKHADLLRAHFMAQPQKLGSEKFAALHTAFVRDGAFIYVPRGVEVPSPIVIAHTASGCHVR